MIWEVIAPMVVAILLILTIGGVILLRPISKRMGDLLEVYAREKEAGATRELRQIRELFETMDARMRLIEERQDFTDKLLEAAPRERVGEMRGDRLGAGRPTSGPSSGPTPGPSAQS